MNLKASTTFTGFLKNKKFLTVENSRLWVELQKILEFWKNRVDPANYEPGFMWKRRL